MNPRQKQQWAARSDVGRVRTHNEDAVLAQPPLYAVADGLGGHEAGEIASSIAIETLLEHAPRHADPSALARAVRAANRAVIDAARQGVGRQGMGTTLVAAMVEGHTVAIVHVGDSRAYLLRHGEIRRLTEDHSMMSDLIRSGQITEADARSHPNRSVITRALGTDLNMEPEAATVTVEPGDRLLLCSDGLTCMLHDSRIAHVLASSADPETAAAQLVREANEAGGQDNISVIVVDIPGDSGGAIDAASSAPRASRAQLFALAMWVVAFVAVVTLAAGGTWAYARSRYYVSAEDGVVTIYRGIPGSVGPIELNWLQTMTPTQVASLPPDAQSRLEDGIEAGSQTEAENVAESLADLARASDATSPTIEY